jgi:hypothetical protein
MTEIPTSADATRPTPQNGRITDPAKEAIQQAQTEIVKAMARSKASIEAAVNQYGSVAGTTGMQDVIQTAIEQAMQAQQTAIQAAQDQALKAIRAAVARYPPTGEDPPAAETAKD